MEFMVYATRCADGTIERHMLHRKTSWQSALADIERFDYTQPCGPHSLMEALITRSPWVAAVEPETTSTAGDSIREGALRYPCPKCSVPAEKPCENLTARRRGELTLTSWPHPDRVNLFFQH